MANCSKVALSAFDLGSSSHRQPPTLVHLSSPSTSRHAFRTRRRRLRDRGRSQPVPMGRTSSQYRSVSEEAKQDTARQQDFTSPPRANASLQAAMRLSKANCADQFVDC
jgi:hypothetical protein